jgi:hypothetical protein
VDNDNVFVNGSMAVIEETEELDCFDKDIHFADYYRPCEKKIQLVNNSSMYI